MHNKAVHIQSLIQENSNINDSAKIKNIYRHHYLDPMTNFCELIFKFSSETLQRN